MIHPEKNFIIQIKCKMKIVNNKPKGVLPKKSLYKHIMNNG